MPSLPSLPSGAKKAGPLGLFRNARHVMSIIKEVSLDEIRDEAERAPRFLLLSDNPDDGPLLTELTGVSGGPTVAADRLDRVPKDVDRYDVVVVLGDSSGATYRSLRDKIEGRVFDAPDASKTGWAETLRGRIVGALPDDAVPLGRWYPAFRPAAAGQVINDTSKANAQFALVANLPSVVPVIGSLTSVGADLIVLTKNQLTMAIKLAAIYGRPLDDRMQILREVLPVAGSGLLWRTIAREATSFIPFAAGAIPKVVIAYAGTMSTGRAIDFYYRFGKRPEKEQLQGYYKQALDTAKRVVPGLKPSGENGASPPSP